MTIAFIGLGNMGMPMARNLLSSGHTLHLYNRSPEKVESFRTTAKIFNDAAAAVSNVDCVITMLSDDDALIDASQKILPAVRPGCIHISMSTISPATSRKLAISFEEVKCSYVAAPVLGRPAAAEAKQLYILCSGKDAAKEKIEIVLSSLGQKIFDFGEDPSSANVMKLIANYLVFSSIEMLSEVILLSEKSGLDKRVVLDTLTSTIFAAPVFKNYGTMIVEEKEISNGFATRLASKDLRLMLETAQASGARLPIGEIVQKHFQDMIANNGSEKDVSSLITYLRSAVPENE